jgi:predicted CXXCH cytochrome family protein
MHRMTRNASVANIRAPFDGSRFLFKRDMAVLETRGNVQFLQIRAGSAAPLGRPSLTPTPAAGDPGGFIQTYRVTRVVGGRTREDFVGIDVAGGTEEVVLPVSYVLPAGPLRYKGYSVMVHERASLRAGPEWSKSCIFCHNTVPQIDWLLGELAGPRAPTYQAPRLDPIVPTNRRVRASVTDATSFARALDAEVNVLSGNQLSGEVSSRELARHVIELVRGRFTGAALVEEGIGCEACHNGASEHASDPLVRPLFAPTAPWLDVAFPQTSDAARVNRVCARCHQVLFSRYPFTWEGGHRRETPGGSHISSGEGRDFLLGGCQSALRCTACHDPHGGTDRASVTPLGEQNATCTRCHATLADSGRLRQHSHHEPTGAAGVCVNCHMPRKNMGLDGRLTRYHRIGSPTDPERVLGDRPLECALCHSDLSVRALVDAMEAWWPVRFPRQRLEELYGSVDANVLRSTVRRGRPHEQAVAMAILGEARARDAVPLIANQLTAEYPLVREWAKRALVSLLGRCDVDLAADSDIIAKQAKACGAESPPPAHGSDLVDEDPED